jgi:hypothetical protein
VRLHRFGGAGCGYYACRFNTQIEQDLAANPGNPLAPNQAHHRHFKSCLELRFSSSKFRKAPFHLVINEPKKSSALRAEFPFYPSKPKGDRIFSRAESPPIMGRSFIHILRGSDAFFSFACLRLCACHWCHWPDQCSAWRLFWAGANSISTFFVRVDILVLQ